MKDYKYIELVKNGTYEYVTRKIGKDGVFRAWFSSEYKGCGNGDYYLLINPTQAIFVEKD